MILIYSARQDISSDIARKYSISKNDYKHVSDRYSIQGLKAKSGIVHSSSMRCNNYQETLAELKIITNKLTYIDDFDDDIVTTS
jgi:hypothetical protein